MQKIKIIGIAGSLRQNSYNKMILNFVKDLLPENAELEILDISLPLFNQDEENNLPEKVMNLKRKVGAADGILIVTPEYSYSVPGVLKNLIDWLSRPTDKNVFDGKIVAIAGASISGFGTLRAQMHLRDIFLYLNVHLVEKPEVYISRIHDKVDQNSNLIDEDSIEKLTFLIEALIERIRKKEC